MIAPIAAAFFLFTALAGRVMAQETQSPFILTVGAVNMTTTDILNIPNNPAALTACKTECDTASSNLAACNEAPDCLCRDDTVTSLQTCEQCMFTFLIDKNLVQTDVRIGSAPVLAAYAATCNATTGQALNATLTALALPPSWVGPDGIFLPTPVLALGVITAFFLGMGSLVLLSNL